jgi:hypothetical protein
MYVMLKARSAASNISLFFLQTKTTVSLLIKQTSCSNYVCNFEAIKDDEKELVIL